MKKSFKTIAISALFATMSLPMLATAKEAKVPVKSLGGWEYQSNAWVTHSSSGKTISGDSQCYQYHDYIKAVSSKAGTTTRRTHRYRAISGSHQGSGTIENGAQDNKGWGYHRIAK